MAYDPTWRPAGFWGARAWLLALLILIAGAVAARAESRAPDLVLTGALTGRAHQTYTELPFRVPAGVERITVEFAHTGKEQRSVIDLGLRDPERFRGWSGGNKSRFTLSETEATPSYLPGPIRAGTWKLVLGAPNIRANAEARYEAKIWLHRKGEAFAGFAEAPLAEGERWWRGDLHMHTGHSDGSCLSRRGAKISCPAFKTAEAAVARGLDFIAVTDHNAISQFGALREIAPYYDDLLIIPGREITTFQGHANVFGPTGHLDFQLGGPRAPDLKAILDQVETAGGLFSINHPGLPSGEICMGCGWTAPDADYARIQAVEVVNGGVAEGPLSGLPFWEARLGEGWRIVGVGGSDNHDPTLSPGKAPAIGVPTTVVRAPQLSETSILQAIRAGHVFIDVEGSRDRILEIDAEAGDARAEMGGSLIAPAGTRVRLLVRTAGIADGMVVLAGDGGRLAANPKAPVTEANALATFEFVADGTRGWVRADVRSRDGRLLLIGNPIHLDPGL
ncbi:MAG: CehA/McbA family metallohydrolase [Phenylobacterium sp.]|uniref:CehA/McbA family metallohydrolase n=1 Tax=Phenylobacterium sp. TaxID=1871053 RepID=UPI0039198889